MDWRSNAAVDTLRRYVDMRVPYPDIARRLGTTTGSVCGKVHRLKIGKGPRDPDRLYVKASKAKKPQLTPDAAYFAIMERQKEEAEARQGLTIALETSEDHHCRYVIGDPAHRQLCGIRRVAGTPYCEEHGALCLSTLSTESRRAMGNGSTNRVIRNFAFYPGALASPRGVLDHRAIDPRTFEEADAPEPATVAA